MLLGVWSLGLLEDLAWNDGYIGNAAGIMVDLLMLSLIFFKAITIGDIECRFAPELLFGVCLAFDYHGYPLERTRIVLSAGGCYDVVAHLHETIIIGTLNVVVVVSECRFGVSLAHSRSSRLKGRGISCIVLACWCAVCCDVVVHLPFLFKTNLLQFPAPASKSLEHQFSGDAVLTQCISEV
jgi:hypothetical protein